MKLFTLFALVALLFATAQASLPKCPCRCTSGSIAAWQCKKSLYHGCKLIPCKTHYRHGLKCCEPSVAPSTTPTATPSSTPSATPSPSMSSTPSATPSPSMSSTPSATPSPSMSSTPSVTPSPSSKPKPSCPCVCRRGIYGKKAAEKECHALHGHCKVTTCSYSRFSCCKY